MDVHLLGSQMRPSMRATWIVPEDVHRFAVGEPCSAPTHPITAIFDARSFEVAKRYDFFSIIGPGPAIVSSRLRALISDLCPSSAQWFRMDIVAGETNVDDHGFHALNVVRKASVIDLTNSKYESTSFGVAFFTKVVLKNLPDDHIPHLFREECYPSFLLANGTFKAAVKRAKLKVKFFSAIEDMGWTEPGD